MMKIKVEFSNKDTIETAYEQATNFAKAINVCVVFEYDGIHCMAFSDGDASRGARSYHLIKAGETYHKVSSNL